MERETKFSDLQGQVLKAVDHTEDEVKFVTEDGKIFKQYHYQDCCESVLVESITGDIADLIGVPILMAEEATSSDTPSGAKTDDYIESQTWTFYKLRTIKGSVDIRWHGTSNGYYSESVTFAQVE